MNYILILILIVAGVCLCEMIIYTKRMVFNAHALGEYNGIRYANTLEAFEESYQRGFRYFEVDVAITKDSFYVMSHLTKQVGEMTKEEFLHSNGVGTKLDLEGLFQLLGKYPDVHIMFDFLPGYYNRSMPGEMAQFAKKICSFEECDRCIIEVYSECNLDAVSKVGFKNIQMAIEPYNQRQWPLKNMEQYICFLKSKNVNIVSICAGDVFWHPLDVIKLRREGFIIYSGIWNKLATLLLCPQSRLIHFVTTDILRPRKQRRYI